MGADAPGGANAAAGTRIGNYPGPSKPAGLSLQGSRTWDAVVTYGGRLVARRGGCCPVIFDADPRSVPQADVDGLRSDLT